MADEFKIKVKAELDQSSINRLQTSINDVTRNSNPSIQLNITQAEQQIANLRTQLQALGNIDINVGGNRSNNGMNNNMNTMRNYRNVVTQTGASIRELERLQSELISTSSKLGRLKIEGNTNGIEQLKRNIGEVLAKYYEMERELRRTLPDNAFDNIQRNAEKFQRSIKEINATKIDKTSIENATNAFNRLKSISSEIKRKQTKLLGLDASSDIQQIEALEKRINELKAEYDTLYNNNKGSFTKKQSSNLKSTQDGLTQDLEIVKKHLEDIRNSKNINIAEKIKTDSITKNISDIDVKIKKLQNSGVQLGSELQKEIDKLKQMGNALNDSVKSGNFSNLTNQLKDYDSQLNKVKNNLSILENENRNFGNSTENIVKNLEEFAMTYFSIQQVFNAFKDGVKFINELDDALINIHYTMDVTKQQLEDVASSSIEMANELKTSTSNVLQSVTLYANAKESTQSILDKSQVAVMLANVTGIQATDTAKMIQSIMNQFKLTQDDLFRISDVIQTVSQNMAYDFSAGIQELAEGIQISGSVAQSAGLSFEEYTSILGTTIEQTGLAGSQIANAYRTIFLRTTKAGEAFGTMEEDISKSEEALRNVGVQVRSTEGEFRPIQDILSDLASKWENLTEVQQNNITYNMAGIRQTNILTSLLKNFDIYESIVDKANNAEGTTLRNQEIYAEGMTATFQNLKNSMEKFWNSIIKSEAVNSIVSVLTFIIDIVTELGDATEGLSNIVLAFGILKLVSNLELVQVALLGIKTVFTTLKANMVIFASISSGIGVIEALKASVSGLFAILQANPIMSVMTALGLLYLTVRKMQNASKELRESSQKNYESNKEEYNSLIEEAESLDTLIEKYKALKKEKNSAETRTEIKGVQEEITELVGEQADNLDLVNGKLDEEIKKLEKIKSKNLEETVQSARNTYNSAVQASNNASGSASGLGTLWFEHDYYGKTDEKALEIIHREIPLSNLNFTKGGFFNTTMYLDAIGSNAKEKAEYLQKLYDILDKDKEYDTNNSEFFSWLGQGIQGYKQTDQQISDSANSLLNNIIEKTENDKTKLDNITVDSLDSYKKYRKEFIKEVKNNNGLTEAIANGDITNKDIKNSIDEYLASIDNFSEYYEEYVKRINASSEEINFDTLEILFSDFNNGSEEAKTKLEEVARSYGLTLEQLEKDVNSHSIASSIQNLWDSDSFKDSREDLEKLASSSKITASDIEELAGENVVLQSVLSETGMSSEYLASIFNNMSIHGTDAFSNITTDALSLNEVLSSMKDELSAVDIEYSELQKQLEEPDYDTRFNYYTDAYKNLAESFKNGEYGKEFFANAEFLFGDVANMESIDQLYERFKKLSSVFGDEDDNGYGFIKKLYKNKDILKDLESSVKLKDDGTYIWDIKEEELDKIAKGLGMTKNAVVACIEATGMYGDLNNYDLDELVETFKGLNSVMTTSDGIAISSVQNVRGLLENLGYTNREIEKIIKNLKKSDEVKLFDFETKDEKKLKKTLDGLTDLTGYDFTNKSAIKLKELLSILANNFGLSEKQTQAFIKTLSKNGYVFTDTSNELEDLKEAVSFEYNSSALSSITEDLETVKESAEKAVKTLNKLDYAGKEDIGKLSFDFDDTNLKSLNKQLETAENIKQKFLNEDGKLDLSIKGANECANIIIGLLKQKQELTKPDVMKINADFAEGEIYEKVLKIQDFLKKNNTYQLELKAGLDTTVSKKARDEALEVLSKDAEITGVMKIDTTSAKTARESIENISLEDWTVKYNVDESKISEYEKSDKDQEANLLYDLKTTEELDSFLKENHNINATVNFEVGKGKDIFETVKNDSKSTSTSTTGGNPTPSPTPTPKAEGTANAQGDWRVGENTDSLVGELGEEMVIRNGRYFTVGKNSAERVRLQKNDIVLNHIQTRQLLENGKIRYGQPRGKLIGTSVSGSAFGFGSIGKNKKPNADDYVKSDSSKKKDSKKDSKKDNTDKKLESFQDWIGKFIDWIEVKLSRLQTRIDKSIEKAERYVEKGNNSNNKKNQDKQYSKASKEYQNAINDTYSLIEANKKGKVKYTNHADKIANRAVKKGLVSENKMEEIKNKVANGTIDISQYNERQQEIIKDYQDYYEKALECANATSSLESKLDEYYDSLYNLPLEKATSNIEKLSESLDNLSSKAEAVNGGGEFYNETVESDAKRRKTKAEEKYENAKETKNSAKEEKSKSQKEVNSISEILKKSNQLTKKQKSTVESGTNKISTKGLKGETLKQVKAYNEAVKVNNSNKKKLEKANEDVSSAKKLKKEAVSDYNKSVKNTDKYKNKKSYVQENDILKEQNKIAKQEVNERNKALTTSNGNLVNAQTIKNNTTKQLEKSKENLSKIKLSKSQKKELESGSKISTKGLKGNDLKAVKAYNKALNEQKKASSSLTKAKEAQQQATSDLEKAEANYTTTIQENTMAMLENIESSYDANLELNNSEIEADKANLELKKKNGETLNRKDYENSISLSEQNEKVAQEKLEDYKKTYEENKDNLSEEEQKNAQAEINNLEKALSEAKSETAELKKESIQVEIDNTQSEIDNLKAQNEILTSLEDKQKNINQQIEYTREYYDLLIEQESNAVKQAELRAEKEKTVLDYLQQQLNIIKEESDEIVDVREAMQNQVESTLNLQAETGKDNVDTRIWNYGWQKNNQDVIATEKHNEAQKLYNTLHGSDYGNWGEDGLFYINNDKLDAYNKGITDYWNIEAEALKAEVNSAQLAYIIWEEQYLNPKLEAYEELQQKAENLESEISLKEAKGIKVEADDYKKQISNAEEQIKSLMDLNTEYQNKQVNYEVGSTKYEELQKLIEENNKAIVEAETNSAELAYTAWEEEYINPKLEAYEELQQKAENLESEISLKEAKGIKVEADDYKKQISNAEEQIKSLMDLNTEYQNKQVNYEVGSTKYEELQKLIEENNKAITENVKSQEEWNQAILNLPLEKIQEELDLLDNISSKTEAKNSLTEAKRQKLYASDYFAQEREIEEKIKKKTEEKATDMEYYTKALNSKDGVYDGHDTDYWLQQMNNADAEIYNLQADIENLKVALRDDVYWRDFEKMHTTLENTSSVLQNISSLINEEMLFEDDGSMTEYGIAQLSNYIKQYETARSQVEAYQQDVTQLKWLYNQGYYTSDEYTEKLNELQNGMLEYANDMSSIQSNIMDMMKKQSEQELNNVFELIDARNELLNKTKEYYDYTKNIKNQTKDINSIKSEIASLQGIETNEAKAKLKRLEEQLSEAETNLEDTVNEHILELSTESLEDLKETLQEMYDDEIKDMSSNLETIAEYMNIANSLTSESTNTIQGTLSKLLDYYGIRSDRTDLHYLDEYASGTKNVSKRQLAWTQEDGSEIIVRKSDGAILTPLEEGDGVIPNNLTNNLYEWGNYTPNDFLNGIKSFNTLPIDTNKPISVNTKYDSLLKVEGNVDRDVLPNLQTILKESYEYTMKQQTKNLKYAGYKPKF